jgi:hypothetical protein
MLKTLSKADKDMRQDSRIFNHNKSALDCETVLPELENSTRYCENNLSTDIHVLGKPQTAKHYIK